MAPKRDASFLTYEQTAAVAREAHAQTLAAGLHGVEATRDATLRPSPRPIHDIAGPVLFHDYDLLDAGGAVVGWIRTAANREVGSPLVSIAHAAPGWDADTALRMARESLHATDPTARIEGSRLVCYAYPKIGIELIYRRPRARKSVARIFDASSGNPVATDVAETHQFTAYSLLERLRRGDRSRVAAFRALEKRLSDPSPRAQASAFGVQVGVVLLSPYCSGSPVGLTHYAQITDYFCVDASAQMLLEHYGWNYTQNQIAAAMGTTAAQGGTSGTGLTTGFASLTNAALTLTFDDAAGRDQQFTDATVEIAANRPLFTQVPHHYRVCVGYADIELLWLSERMLYIYDPWPWSGDECAPGAPYWEAWDSSPVMWFGIAHHA